MQMTKRNLCNEIIEGFESLKKSRLIKTTLPGFEKELKTKPTLSSKTVKVIRNQWNFSKQEFDDHQE
ncbi:hypothetical protein [Polynucleobacter rarus]|uniref:hypothetical protein n=1 Tax=Polynucleobacter rarus TaxID=556055 RepID=UPI00131F2085|nr:hypothetical protein [Polynucleobacter rarus]